MANFKIQKLPTIRRMPTYLHKLIEMDKAGVCIVATPELARYMNLAEIVIRKDLAITGITGQPGVGYKVPELIGAIRRFLKWDNPSEAVLVGAGSLGHALMGYEGFADHGLNIVTAFDASPAKIGTRVYDREVRDVAGLTDYLRETGIGIGIICVPAVHAQSIADLMVAGGIRGIWNFANVSLKVPDHVVVQREVIAGGFAVLSVKLYQKQLTESIEEGEKK
jgi:redox-sensing transcriptional repressor